MCPGPVCSQKHTLTSLPSKAVVLARPWGAHVQGHLPDARSLRCLPVCTSVPRRRAIPHWTHSPSLTTADLRRTWAVHRRKQLTTPARGCGTARWPSTAPPAGLAQRAGRYRKPNSWDLLWILKVCIWKQHLAVGDGGLSRPEDFIGQRTSSTKGIYYGLSDAGCGRPPFGSRVKAQQFRCKLLLKVNFSKQVSCSKPTYELWSLSPSRVNQCVALRLLVDCQLSLLCPEGWDPPFRPSPLHPFHPGNARKALKKLCIKWTMLCIGIQETLCPIPHDLNKVTILLFPLPPI